jgi:hypothetical protein
MKMEKEVMVINGVEMEVPVKICDRESGRNRRRKANRKKYNKGRRFFDEGMEDEE